MVREHIVALAGGASHFVYTKEATAEGGSYSTNCGQGMRAQQITKTRGSTHVGHHAVTSTVLPVMAQQAAWRASALVAAIMVHVSAQHSGHTRLIARTLGAEPRQHVGIDAQRHQHLGLTRGWAYAGRPGSPGCGGEHTSEGSHLRNDGVLTIGLLASVEGPPVTG